MKLYLFQHWFSSLDITFDIIWLIGELENSTHSSWVKVFTNIKAKNSYISIQNVQHEFAYFEAAENGNNIHA